MNALKGQISVSTTAWILQVLTLAHVTMATPSPAMDSTA